MFLLFLQFVFLAGVIVVAGMFLTDAADAISDRTGLGRTLAGLVLLAAATSLPELAVDCSLVRLPTPAPDLAVGALIGSSLFNLLILGMLDFCHRHDQSVFSPTCEEHTLSAVTSVVLTSLVILFLVLSSSNIIFEWNQMGLGPALIFCVYVASLRLIYLDQKNRQTDDSEEATGLSLGKATGIYLLTTLVIFVAAHFLAPTANKIAEQSGLGGTFVGSTFVALVTSLPELVTTLAAIRIGAFNMAMGNVVGSNNFNMAILFPVDFAYRDAALLPAAALSHAVTGSIVILITGVLLLSISYRAKTKKWLWFVEPSAGMVVALAISAFVLLYFLKPSG